MQDRPRAEEMLAAAAEFLFTDVAGAVAPEKRFQVLVCANVCQIVAREIEQGRALDAADLELFSSLLGGAEHGDARQAATELAGRIRAGDLDADLDGLADRLREHVRRKLSIARPGYDAS